MRTVRNIQALVRRAGAWRQSPVLLLIAAAFCAWIALDAALFQLSSGLSRPTYDAMVRNRLWTPAPDPRIVLVDIDEASLARMAPDFGRWPWPRDTLATVMAHLERQRAAAIVWDIAFADADRLSPGGDAALDQAARASPHSVHSVVRLPRAGDAASQLAASDLPGLLAAPARGDAHVALIPPVLPGVAAGRLGFNNVGPDDDGVVRRYRFFERLPDGTVLKSLASAAAEVADPAAYARGWQRTQRGGSEQPLLAWPMRSGTLPVVPFWQVFQQAEGNASLPPTHFENRIVVVGSTAPSLHDIHPTPLAPAAPGLETLAVAIDNALHQRHLVELPLAVQAGVAMALCVLLAWRAWRTSVSELEPLLLPLPLSLLAVSFASLHTDWVFLDLQLAATFALALLAVLRLWNRMRRNHWCQAPGDYAQPLALWACRSEDAWQDRFVDGLMDVLQQHAPATRLILPENEARWPAQPRWPELVACLAFAGPPEEVERARASLQPLLDAAQARTAQPVQLAAGWNRAALAQLCLEQWARLGPAPTSPQTAEALS